MTIITIVCARCTLTNHVSERYCSCCGLPLGAVLADAGAGIDALGPYEVPEPADPDVARLILRIRPPGRIRSRTPRARAGRLVVPLRLDRKQAVYLGPAGTDAEGRAIPRPWSPSAGRSTTATAAPCSSSTPGSSRATSRSASCEARNTSSSSRTPCRDPPTIDANGLIRRVAELADGLEERLSRGGDIY